MKSRFLLSLLLAGCTETSEPPDAPHAVDGGANVPADEVGCEPDCHYDCLGPPLTCVAGVVFQQAYGPRPCCHASDFDGMDVCGRHEIARCASKTCDPDAGFSFSPSGDANALCAPPDAAADDDSAATSDADAAVDSDADA